MQERRLQCKILPNLNCSSLTTYLKYDQGEDKAGVSYIDPHTEARPWLMREVKLLCVD